jgi:AmmeMemoRadiSam system protein B
VDAAGERKVFVLASTDMSHFPPYGAAQKGDRATLDVVATGDPQRLFEHLDRTEAGGTVPNLQTAMCARGGVGTAMYFAKARGATHVQVLRYANSGDVPAGGRDRVVGYCSAVLVKKH